MRHRNRRGKLTVTSAHQRAMGRNMAAALFQYGQVVTTVAKAKSFRPFAEKLITIARHGNAAKATGTEEGAARWLHSVRHAASILPNRSAVRRLFNDVAVAAKDRPGGYVRILRLSERVLGDNSPKALLMLVDRPAAPEVTEGEAKASGEISKEGARKTRAEKTAAAKS